MNRSTLLLILPLFEACLLYYECLIYIYIYIYISTSAESVLVLSWNKSQQTTPPSVCCLEIAVIRTCLKKEIG